MHCGAVDAEVGLDDHLMWDAALVLYEFARPGFGSDEDVVLDHPVVQAFGAV